MNIFWNALSRKKIGYYLSGLLGKRKHLDVEKYASLMQKTKVCINTLSPMGLVSPRFFECMATGTLVFCEESELYNQIFTDGTYITFRSDLSDFDEKLFHYLNNEDDRNRITKKANAIVKNEHTWAKRIRVMLNAIEKKSTGQAVV
jgi:spore maturation protein CgeB